MKNDKKIDARIKIALRQLFLKSEYRNNKIKNARVAKATYRCECCGNDYKLNEVNVHHITPVQYANDWNDYIFLLFCNENGLQVLCKKCHEKQHSNNE